MVLYDFLRIIQNCGYLCHIRFAVSLCKCIFLLGINSDDRRLVDDRHLMKQDVALEILTPNQETRSLPYFYGCCGEGSEER